MKSIVENVQKLETKHRKATQLIAELKQRGSIFTDLGKVLDKMITLQQASKDAYLAKAALVRITNTPHPLYPVGTAVVGENEQEMIVDKNDIKRPHHPVSDLRKLQEAHVTAKRYITSLEIELAAQKNLNASLQETLLRYQNKA